MKAVAKPNLPSRQARLVAMAAEYPMLTEQLEREGIEVLKIRPAATLPSPVASHSDLQLLQLYGGSVLLAREADYLAQELYRYGLDTEMLGISLGNRYPQDVLLNYLLLNNCCFGLCSNMPLQLKKHCNDTGLQLVDVKQGYTRCSTLVVGERAAVTADLPLAKSLAENGIDVLVISGRGILLPGYDCGFIGGCGGLIATKRLAVTGSFDAIPERIELLNFLAKHGVRPFYLTNGSLIDIGGILPLAD